MPPKQRRVVVAAKKKEKSTPQDDPSPGSRHQFFAEVTGFLESGENVEPTVSDPVKLAGNTAGINFLQSGSTKENKNGTRRPMSNIVYPYPARSPHTMSNEEDLKSAPSLGDRRMAISPQASLTSELRRRIICCDRSKSPVVGPKKRIALSDAEGGCPKKVDNDSEACADYAHVMYRFPNAEHHDQPVHCIDLDGDGRSSGPETQKVRRGSAIRNFLLSRTVGDSSDEVVEASGRGVRLRRRSLFRTFGRTPSTCSTSAFSEDLVGSTTLNPSVPSSEGSTVVVSSEGATLLCDQQNRRSNYQRHHAPSILSSLRRKSVAKPVDSDGIQVINE